MNFMKKRFTVGNAASKKARRVAKGFFITAVIAGGAGVVAQAALAQALLQKQGTLAPVEDTYTFEGESGQAMTIELQSDDFDTLLLLNGPDGETLTSNDDYGGTFNSTIVIELPESGMYSAIATSFDGKGGNYEIEVRPATEYEQAFSRAYNLSLSEDFGESVDAYTAAIAINDADPNAYLGRAESIINRAYLSADLEVSGLQDLPEDVIEAIVTDYFKAADLLEQQGETESAESLREQAQYFTGEPPAPAVPGEVTPDIEEPTAVPSEVEAPVIDAPIPVEPDGGIGDGATPLPAPEE